MYFIFNHAAIGAPVQLLTELQGGQSEDAYSFIIPAKINRPIMNAGETRDQRTARRQSDVISAARAAWSGSAASAARG